MDAFLLVRHARTKRDPGLPSAHWRLEPSAVVECEMLASHIAALEPSVIVSSSEPKAVATGTALAHALRVPHATAEGLEEHDRTGVPYVHDEAVWHATLEALFRQPDRRALGAETANEALARFDAAVRDVLEAHARPMPVVVSHATVMSLFVARHNDLDAWAFWRTLRMPDALVVRRLDFSLVARYRADGAAPIVE